MQACKHLHDPGTTVNKIMEPAQSQGKCKKNVSQKKGNQIFQWFAVKCSLLKFSKNNFTNCTSYSVFFTADLWFIEFQLSIGPLSYKHNRQKLWGHQNLTRIKWVQYELYKRTIMETRFSKLYNWTWAKKVLINMWNML